MATVTTEAWPATFGHADFAPEGGNVITRIAGGSGASGGLTIIFLHGAGLGDGPDGWVGLWTSLLEHLPAGTEVLVPSGPHITTSWSGDCAPGWIKFSAPKTFNPQSVINPRSVMEREDLEFGGLDDVAEAVQGLVDAECRRPGRQAVLGGFSQGGAVSLWTAATATVRPSAVFALSGYMPQPHRLSQDASPPPTLLLHGEADTVINVELCELTHQLFAERHWADVQVQRYPGLKHKVKRDELLYLCQWLRRFAPDDFPFEGQGAEAAERSRL